MKDLSQIIPEWKSEKDMSGNVLSTFTLQTYNEPGTRDKVVKQSKHSMYLHGVYPPVSRQTWNNLQKIYIINSEKWY